MIYFDHNATTPVEPEVAAAVDEAWHAGFAHPESLHAAGRLARRRLEEARQSLLKACSAEGAQVAFFASGTQANQAAVAAVAKRPTARIVASPVEHPSLLDILQRVAHQGHDVRWLRVDSCGRIQLDELAQCLDQPTDLVVIQGANHETGVVQPLEAIGSVCSGTGTPWLIDAVQLVGKAPFRFNGIGATLATLSAHKFGGPRGIAALLVAPRPDHRLEPADFPDWDATGTDPVELAIGLQAAVERLTTQRMARLRELRERLERRLLDDFTAAVIHGRAADRIAQTTFVAFPGVDRQALLMALDQHGIACSSGAACRSGAAEPSPTLVAMGVPAGHLESSIRISLGPTNTRSEIDHFMEILADLIPRLRSAS